MNASLRGGFAGLALLAPCAALAHALSSTFYPIGPVPILLVFERGAGALLPIAALAALTWILHARLPTPTWGGSAWRAALLYLAARAGETISVVLLQTVPGMRHAGWGEISAREIALLLLLFASGMVVALPASLALYRSQGASPRRILTTTLLASFTAYFAALACGIAINLTSGY